MLGKLLYVFYCIQTFTVIESRRPDCSTTIAVEGLESKIICDFNQDVSIAKASIMILRHDQLIIPEVVLTCNWPRTGDAPECTKRPGHEFDPFDLHRTATVTIPYTTSRHGGNYTCQSSLHVHASLKCPLKVIGNRNSCTAGRVNVGERSTIVCHFNQDLQQFRGSFAVRKLQGDEDFDTVFACNWAESQQKYVCANNPDYMLTSEITRSVAISVSKTEQRHGGQYLCVTVPEYRGVVSETCSLEVTSITSSTQNPTTQIPSALGFNSGEEYSNVENKAICIVCIVRIVALAVMVNKTVMYMNLLGIFHFLVFVSLRLGV